MHRIRFLAPSIALACVMLFALTPLTSGVSFENQTKVYKDRTSDVVVDDGTSPLETLSDLNALPTRKAPESRERLSIDIVQLKVLENDTYVSYVLEMLGPVYARLEYHYVIAGYARKEVKE